ncbi:hypothetical protein JFU03_22075 [Bacillus sp. TH44]|uniref:hypothetical protein n=1 Tax=Bacillus sp. TH50 TaxID=2796414 RepID=UPI001A3E3FC1|nr:hypothetical protein [Bacillus sp. TH50]MBK5360539.1 hypothetical protein [Bacillus sp. TH44]
MGQLVDMNGYSDNGEVIVQIINYGDIIPEEDLPPSNNQHHKRLNRLSKRKKLCTMQAFFMISLLNYS